MEHGAYIGLGSNLEAPTRQVLAACDEIAATPGVRLLARSALYRSAPVGYAEQPDFVNAVVAVATSLPPQALLAALFAIEREHRRVRPDVGLVLGPGVRTDAREPASEALRARLRNGPRTLDLDILIYGDLLSTDATLVLPHPRMHERAFVLQPLLDVAPGCVIPGRGPAAEWLSRCAGQAIARIADGEY